MCVFAVGTKKNTELMIHYFRMFARPYRGKVLPAFSILLPPLLPLLPLPPLRRHTIYWSRLTTGNLLTTIGKRGYKYYWVKCLRKRRSNATVHCWIFLCEHCFRNENIYRCILSLHSMLNMLKQIKNTIIDSWMPLPA